MSDKNSNQPEDISIDEIEKCISTLERLVKDTDQIFEIPKSLRTALIKASGQLSRPSREEFSRRKKDAKKAAKRKQAAKDRSARKETGIRSAREAHIFVAPKLLPEADLKAKEQLELESPRNCYVCKTVYNKLHHFYDTMCEECGDFNYAKRFQTTDLKDQVAVITGSRLKIGYHITLMLLRSGATVVATTFIADALIEAYEITKNDSYLDVAISASKFVLNDLNRSYNDEGDFTFSYSPIDKTQVYNAGLLVIKY